MGNNSTWSSFVETLDFHPFVQSPLPVSPTDSELQEVVSKVSPIAAATVLNSYFQASAEHLSKCGVRPGSVLRLKNGSCLLVGHVSERLGYVDDEMFVDLDEVEAIAYLY
ncbi:MAG: hypothetical protein JSS66_07685 [Armatimonadetes bacterium]|nr:hypothetical protein [Armatimonadota bacterium]